MSKSAKANPLRGKHGVYKQGRKWLTVVELPRDAKTGARKRVWLRGFETRKAAEAARNRARADVGHGVLIAPDKLTVSALVTRWLDDAKASLGAKTYQEYVSLANRCIVPLLGAMSLTKLRPIHVQEAYGVLLTHGRANGNGGLSPTTVRHAHGLLKAMLDWAVRMQIVPRNVAEAVNAPSRVRSTANAFTNDEIARVLAAAAGTRWYTAIVLAVATGMRRGEVSALRWDDVDLEKQAITVRASLSQTRAGVVLKSTKTGRIRTIPLAPMR